MKLLPSISPRFIETIEIILIIIIKITELCTNFRNDQI